MQRNAASLIIQVLIRTQLIAAASAAPPTDQQRTMNKVLQPVCMHHLRHNLLGPVHCPLPGASHGVAVVSPAKDTPGKQQIGVVFSITPGSTIAMPDCYST